MRLNLAIFWQSAKVADLFVMGAGDLMSLKNHLESTGMAIH
jgi:hypothetical protein